MSIFMKLSYRLEPICARRFRRINHKSAILFDTSSPGLTRRNLVIRPDVGFCWLMLAYVGLCPLCIATRERIPQHIGLAQADSRSAAKKKLVMRFSSLHCSIADDLERRPECRIGIARVGCVVQIRQHRPPKTFRPADGRISLQVLESRGCQPRGDVRVNGPVRHQQRPCAGILIGT